MMKTQISVIVPLYRCSNSIINLTDRLSKTLDSITTDYEIILVNDSSPEKDWELVNHCAESDSRIKGINLSRNFGQHYAIYAGLESASGEWIVVMDGDLQDQPEEIPNLLNKASEGYDIVFAKRQSRQDNFIKKSGSVFFYKVLAYLTDTEQNAEIANFGIYHRKVVNAIVSMNDYVRYFPTMVRWVGFKQSDIYVNHAPRSEGKSGYNIKGLVKLAVNVILSFTDKPLRLTVKLGLYISGFSILAVLYYLYLSFSGQIEVMGYASLIISIWLLSGIIITLLGMVGLYVGKIFEQVKGRPNYIICEKINI